MACAHTLSSLQVMEAAAVAVATIVAAETIVGTVVVVVTAVAAMNLPAKATIAVAVATIGVETINKILVAVEMITLWKRSMIQSSFRTYLAG